MKGDRSDEELALLEELKQARAAAVPDQARIEELKNEVRWRYNSTHRCRNATADAPSQCRDPGGRSRSPSWGRWSSDDYPD